MTEFIRNGMHSLMLSAVVALAIAGPAQAQPEGEPSVPASEVQQMYDSALQSIAEGRKNDASAMLMRVIEKESLHAGAYLEVALIQCSLGRAEEAERLFAIVETRFNPPLAILELIAEARATGCDKWQPLSSTAVTLGRGHDMNVNQGASNPIYIVERDGGQIELPLSPDFLPQHDQYTALNVEHSREVTANGTYGFMQFVGRRNDSLSQYDLASLYLGLDTPHRVGQWAVRTTAMLGLTALGGKYYQRQLQLQARVVPPLRLPANTSFALTGSVARNEYMTLTNFDSSTFEVRGQLAYAKDKLHLSGSHGLLSDRAVSERPGGNRHGSSSHLLGRYAISGSLSGELGYSYNTWKSSEMYAPGLIDQVRNQSTRVTRATLSWPIRKNHTLQLEARIIRNREDITIFAYNNRILQLSWLVYGL